MSKGLLFWVVYVLALALYGWVCYPFDKRGAAAFVFFVLIGLLGWAVFGPAVY